MNNTTVIIRANFASSERPDCVKRDAFFLKRKETWIFWKSDLQKKHVMLPLKAH